MFLSIKTMIDIPAVFICTCRLNAHMHKVKQLNTFFSFVKGNSIIILLNTKDIVLGFFFYLSDNSCFGFDLSLFS